MDHSTPQKITRREFLSILALASLATVFAKGVQALLEFARPPKTRNQIGGVFDLGGYADLNLEQGIPRRFPQGRFWLVKKEEGLLALNGLCTHLDCLFDWDGTANHFFCPCHGSQFNPNGECLNGPASRNLDQYVVRLLDENGNLVAETDHQAGGALSLPGATPTSTSESSLVATKLRVEIDTGVKISGNGV